MKKRLSALLLLLALLTSCSSTDPGRVETGTTGAETDTAPVSSAETEPETTDPRNIPDEVPELNFNGESFRSIGQSSAKQDIYVAEESGEVLNDAIYARNRYVEERLGVVIAPMEAVWYTALSAQIKQCVNAGDDAYDLVLGQMAQSGSDALGGIYQNWYNIEHMDFEKPWYPKSVTNDSASINGRMYTIVSDMLISFASNTWAIVYDKVEADNFNLGNLYEKVYAGEWTLDYLLELCSTVYTDLNGDGVRDEGDMYAFSSASQDGCLMAAFLYGSEVKFAVLGEQQIDVTLNSEKTVSVFEKLHRLFYESQGVWDTGTAYVSNNGAVNRVLTDRFLDGKTVFCNTTVGYVGSGMREYENDYGLLPIPKYDEEQKEYYTVTDAGCNIMAVPVTAKKNSMIGAVTECLAAESYRSVMPVYYDLTLGTKGVRDAESSLMMDYILQSRQIDFAYMYDGSGGWLFKTSTFIENPGKFASGYEKYEKAVKNYYNKVLSFFYKAEE